MLDEELAAALGCEAYQRCKGRRGYRNGSEQRPLTTEIGTRDIRVPRGRLQQNDGTTAEFRSELLPRYGRTKAILGIYLAGANSRRQGPGAAAGTAHLRLQECRLPRRRASEEVIRERNERDLCEERYAILYVDGFHLKVRLARRVVSVPVLAVLGVAEDGTKVLVSLRLAARRQPATGPVSCSTCSGAGWLRRRCSLSTAIAGCARPSRAGPRSRCRLVNLIEHCPVHARAERRGIVNARDGMAGRKASRRSWRSGRRCAPQWLDRSPGTSY